MLEGVVSATGSSAHVFPSDTSHPSYSGEKSSRESWKKCARKIVLCLSIRTLLGSAPLTDSSIRRVSNMRGRLDLSKEKFSLLQHYRFQHKNSETTSPIQQLAFSQSGKDKHCEGKSPLSFESSLAKGFTRILQPVRNWANGGFPAPPHTRFRAKFFFIGRIILLM